MNTCHRCNKEIIKPANSCTTGYGIDRDDNKICFACCGELDAAEMIATGRITLYLCEDKRGQHTVTNWPGSLSIPITHIRKGKHSIARWRYDVWFTYAGELWHGVQYGDNTQLCHCKRSKRMAA
jgi:hypothetical protein